jgi:nucleotide-binding universal stress UspA family protein
MSWLPKRSVAVPLDFSEQSMGALNVALGLVEDAANVHVIHVLPPLSVFDVRAVWADTEDQGRCRHCETALRERLRAPKYDKVRINVAIGDPGHEIADFAEQLGAELIVLPSHGRTGLSRLLIGSVAERVVRLAHCPVLVLRS